MVINALIRSFLKPSGMKNKGNTCFFNATMQCMLSFSAFIAYFKRNEFHEKRQPISAALKAFIYEYQSYKVIDPQNFIRSIRGKLKLFDGHQQDAHCFLDVFLNTLIEEQGPDPNALKNMFKIVNEDLITCHKCSYLNEVRTEMSNIPLFIQSSVADSLQSYLTRNDVFKTGDLSICSGCGKNNIVSIRDQIIEGSSCFIIQLHRFEGIERKNNKSIYIDEEISIGDSVYENTGVVCHIGTLNTGHYYAKGRRDNLWYEFNDSSAVRTDRAFEGNMPYLLFYTKKH